VIFGPEDVMVYRILGTMILKGRRLDFRVYVHDVKKVSICEKMRMDEAIDFWHTHLGHAGYAKLKIVMLKLILKSLPKL
jgi:hypothetical protein